MADKQSAGTTRSANDIEIIGIVVNEKGAERAIATEAVSTLVPLLISETFLRKNQNQTLDESYKVLGIDQKKSRQHGLSTVAYIRWRLETRMAIRGMRRTFARALDKLVDLEYTIRSLADTSAWRVLI